MKNPDSKPLRIVAPQWHNSSEPFGSNRMLVANSRAIQNYGLMLSNLAIAQSNLVKAGKDSAMPHFIAIVKELESIYGFEFNIMEGE